MPGLMHACDVLVQNAGGLTSLEALAGGLPVVSYRCIPGHGRTNAAALDEVGLAPWIREPDQLAPTLTELLHGPRGRGAARGGPGPVRRGPRRTGRHDDGPRPAVRHRPSVPAPPGRRAARRCLRRVRGTYCVPADRLAGVPSDAPRSVPVEALRLPVAARFAARSRQARRRTVLMVAAVAAASPSAPRSPTPTGGPPATTSVRSPTTWRTTTDEVRPGPDGPYRSAGRGDRPARARRRARRAGDLHLRPAAQPGHAPPRRPRPPRPCRAHLRRRARPPLHPALLRLLERHGASGRPSSCWARCWPARRPRQGDGRRRARSASTAGTTAPCCCAGGPRATYDDLARARDAVAEVTGRRPRCSGRRTG